MTRVILVHSSTTLIIGGVGTALFGILVVASSNSSRPDDWWAPFVFMGFVLLGAVTVAEAVRVRHELTDTGIAYQGLLRRYDQIRWNEIVSARWSPGMKWLVVTTGDGRVMRFSGLLNGLESLAIALSERVPALDADKETAQMLADARQGRLPKVY